MLVILILFISKYESFKSFYNKAYKRNNSRVRSKKITQSEFFKWSDDTRKKRDLALSGKISLKEFEKWCESSR